MGEVPHRCCGTAEEETSPSALGIAAGSVGGRYQPGKGRGGFALRIPAAAPAAVPAGGLRAVGKCDQNPQLPGRVRWASRQSNKAWMWILTQELR